MRSPLLLIFSALLWIVSVGTTRAEADLSQKGNSSVPHEDPFLKKKSDTAIKPFVFPKSMKVVQICAVIPDRCFFFKPGYGPESYKEAETGVSLDQINRIFLSKTSIKKTLLKIDPARIAPVSLGKAMQKSPSGSLVFKVKEKSDFILYFKSTFDLGHPSEKVLTEGRIYLPRQKKVLVVPSNHQKISFKHMGTQYHGQFQEGNPPIPNFKNTVTETHFKGLQQLAKDARKVIMSHKYEKRRSNY